MYKSVFDFARNRFHCAQKMLRGLHIYLFFSDFFVRNMLDFDGDVQGNTPFIT